MCGHIVLECTWRGATLVRPIARARASRQSEMCEQGGNANKTMTCWLKRSGVKGSGNAMWAQPKVGVAALCSRLHAHAFQAVRPPPCTMCKKGLPGRHSRTRCMVQGRWRKKRGMAIGRQKKRSALVACGLHVRGRLCTCDMLRDDRKQPRPITPPKRTKPNVNPEEVAMGRRPHLVSPCLFSLIFARFDMCGRGQIDAYTYCDLHACLPAYIACMISPSSVCLPACKQASKYALLMHVYVCVSVCVCV